MKKKPCVRSRTWSAVLLLLLTLLLLGCGNDRPKTVPVKGKVTFGGGPCPAEGYIDFRPLEAAAGYPIHPGSARFGIDGTFSVTSYESGDGLVPGRYRVHIDCWKELPDEATMSAGVSYVPEGFEAPEVVVAASDRGPIAVDVNVPYQNKSGGD